MTLPMALPPSPSDRPRLSRRIAGVLGFWTAIILLRFSLKHSIALFAALKRRTPALATVAETADAVAAARAAAKWFPGRAACLENSLATALTAILMRRSPDWCIGVRLMPYAAHAWVEVEGTPVGEQPEPDRPFIVITRT